MRDAQAKRGADEGKCGRYAERKVCTRDAREGRSVRAVGREDKVLDRQVGEAGVERGRKSLCSAREIERIERQEIEIKKCINI